MSRISKGLTLVELLIALILLSVIVLGLASIDFFSLFHVISSDRRAKLQNEASLVLEHMTKEINRAIGDINQLPVSITTIGGDQAIRVWIDISGNGLRDPYPTDHEIAYRFTDAVGNPIDRYQVWYYANCVGPNCNQAGSIGPEVIARQITAFNVTYDNTTFDGDPVDNYIDISISACWDPSQATSPDNPSVDMKAGMQMPAVSTN